jgi:two-component system sensor histidine kinase/response regulator
MNSKKLYFQNNFKPFENSAKGKNGSSKLSGLSTVIDEPDKASENYFTLRLQKMEEINARLQKLVEQRTKKLTEVVATNTKFISIIAHDLRSPFISILYALKMVKESLNDHNIVEIENYIDIAAKHANSTLNLLDDLLAWAISQNTEKSFNPVKINLHKLLRGEIEYINTSAKQKQIKLNLSIALNLNVSADLQMVKTILRNLISNAIKFTDTGGEITISASESKPFVEIVVKDTGIGISSGAQRDLFNINAFHSTTGTNNEKGIGLGLFLCKDFVERHGGDIRIESEPGKGSKFKFTLPHYI